MEMHSPKPPRKRCRPTLLICLLLIWPWISQAEDQEDALDFNPEEAKKSVSSEALEAAEKPWAPSEPPPDKFDWIQLNSGEWLKGELKVLYDDKLEFDSDELDLLKLDIDDVARIRGHGIKGVRLEGPITLYGILEVTQNEVHITNKDGTQSFDRSMLITIVSGEKRERNFWSAKITLGLNLTGGNTEQVDYSSLINVKRRTAHTRIVLDYLGNYSRTRGVDTIDNNRLTGNYDIFRTRKYFLTPVFGEYFRDPFQNIQFRGTIGTGIGYHVVKTKKTELDVTTGIAYASTRFVSVQEGEDERVSTPALVIGTRYDTELTKTVDFITSYAFNIVNKDSGSYTHHLIATLETEILSWLDFDTSFVWDRTQNPTADADGTLPERDDYKLIFGLGVDF